MRRLYCCADQLFCVKYSSSCVRPVELHFTALVVHGLSNFGDQRSIDAVVTLYESMGQGCLSNDFEDCHSSFDFAERRDCIPGAVTLAVSASGKHFSSPP